MKVDLEPRALASAGAVASSQGVPQTGAIVLHSGSNVIVHLRPAPVVARVMIGTVVLHDDPQRWLEREVAVLRYLAPTGLAVAPSPLIAPGPYEHDGLWMTFAEWIPGIEHRTQLPDAHRLGWALRNLHDELRTFDGELGGLWSLREDIGRLRGRLRPRGAVEATRLSSLGARLEALDEAVFESMLPAQALHGDVSLSDLLATPQRLVWNDFEDTFRGPVHWDVAGYLMSVRARGAGPSFVQRMLDAYGWGDERELAPFIAAHQVYDEIWQMYEDQHRSAGRSRRPCSSPARALEDDPSLVD